MLNVVKKVLFWSHLVSGLIAGVVIFVLALSGALLTYERQILEWDEVRHTLVTPQPAQKASKTALLQKLSSLAPDEHHIFMRFVNREGAAVPVWAGSNAFLLDPHTGEVIRDGPGALAIAFYVVKNIHRWLAFSGDYQEFGKSVTAYANLVFIFLLFSGLYLWFPRKFTRRGLKQQLLLGSKYANKHSKYRRWHFVFGFWSLIPLIVIATSATIFHFKWANEFVYAFYGESVPQRETHEELTHFNTRSIDVDALFDVATQHAKDNGAEDWYSMWLELGEVDNEARFFIDKTIGHQHDQAYSLFVDTRTHEVLRAKFQGDWSKGDQAWDVVRFLHTGEYFGIVGQTIAGVVSLFCCLLIYTGWLLAWKRLKRA